MSARSPHEGTPRNEGYRSEAPQRSWQERAMSRPAFGLGLDHGTSSCRALLVDLDTGTEVAEAVHVYEGGEAGVWMSADDPDVARQDPRDHLRGLEATASAVLAQAREDLPGFDPASVVGIGVATTGSTPLPLDRDGQPLASTRSDLAALAWLWKDHSAHEEAAAITRAAHEHRPQYVAACGGTYSAEWFWAKLWHCLRAAPDVFAQAHGWVELADWLPGSWSVRPRPNGSRGDCARPGTRRCTTRCGAAGRTRSSCACSTPSSRRCAPGWVDRPCRRVREPAACARRGPGGWGWRRGHPSRWAVSTRMPAPWPRAWRRVCSSRSWAPVRATSRSADRARGPNGAGCVRSRPRLGAAGALRDRGRSERRGRRVRVGRRPARRQLHDAGGSRRAGRGAGAG